MPTCFLNIQKIEQSCLFQLTWGKGQRLKATVPYPTQLTQLHKDWQRAYLNYYRSALRGRAGAVGSVAAPPVNWHSQLVQSEAKLLSAFHHWLRSAELFDIRQTIMGLPSLLEQQSPTAGEAKTEAIDVFLTCEPMEVARLPWESWELGTEPRKTRPVRFARMPANIRAESAPRQDFRHGRARILVILGDEGKEAGLDFQEDLRSIQQLRKLAEVKFVGWEPGMDAITLKTEVCEAIASPQGWDILFFAGHSNENKIVGGEFKLGPEIALAMSVVQPYLTTAKERGLQFALFNSCNGIDIAEALIDLGLSQVIVMREPIHNQVAGVFLTQFLLHLAQHEDVHDALLRTCDFLKSQQQITYPSAALVPSLFRHPDATLYQLQSNGWQQRLRQLVPSRREAIALSALALLSLVPSIYEGLLDQRVWTQAVYRDLTGQTFASSSKPTLLVQFDDESIQRAGIRDPHPIPRDYLAQLITQLSAQGATVVGVDYLLDRPHEGEDALLNQALEQAVREQNTWFVLATKRGKQGQWLGTWPEIADLKWGLEGDLWVPFWRVQPLRDDRPHPFSYQLALAHQLQHEAQLGAAVPQPNLDSPQDLQQQVAAYLESPNRTADPRADPPAPTAHQPWLLPLTRLSYRFRQRWLMPLMDLSLSPTQMYTAVPAWQLLETPETVLEQLDLASLDQQIVVIAAGGYDEAGFTQAGEDNFEAPPAITYWRNQMDEPNRGFTGGEAHTYMIHHVLNQHFVVPIPSLWIIALVGAGSKLLMLVPGWQRRLPEMASRQQTRWLTFGLGALGYGLISLQLYVSAQIALPWLLPTLALGVVMLPRSAK